jgi:hypothetical protein
MPSRVWQGPWLKSGPAQNWPWEEKLLNAVCIVKPELPWHFLGHASELVCPDISLSKSHSGSANLQEKGQGSGAEITKESECIVACRD